MASEEKVCVDLITFLDTNRLKILFGYSTGGDRVRAAIANHYMMQTDKSFKFWAEPGRCQGEALYNLARELTSCHKLAHENGKTVFRHVGDKFHLGLGKATEREYPSVGTFFMRGREERLKKGEI